jgi:hypothetical protein
MAVEAPERVVLHASDTIGRRRHDEAKFPAGVDWAAASLLFIRAVDD